MSTDFLNRRMDLKHTSSSENHLIMDTSYPVKLAGKILKIFTACSVFNTNNWVIENSDKERILTVGSDNVYDFAGRVIKDNIGIDKPYSTNISVYNQNDYVMVIIDFDNNNLLLCSQTNFENFIVDTKDNDDKFRLFVIDGETKLENFDFPIDEETFDNAVKFDGESEKYAFIRSDIDKVVYQSPTNENGSRNMTPVSNVDTININSLNVSVQNLIYPFINLTNTDSGFENITGIHSFRTINGSVNDKFIEEFCFSESELINLPIWNAEQKCYFHDEYYNIVGDKSKYYYVFSTNCAYKDQFKSDEPDDTMMANPINISNKKFSTFYNFNNSGIVVGTKTVGIAMKNSNPSLIGNWWNNDNQNGFYVYNDDNYKNIYIDNFITSNHEIPYNIFVEKDRNTNGIANISMINIEDSKDTIYNSSIMSYIKRFVEFFASYDNNYCEQIKSRILSLANDPESTKNYPIFRNDNGIPFTVSPKNIVIMYPEIFENVLFDKNSNGSFTHNSENLHNFKSFYNNNSPTNFSRSRYIINDPNNYNTLSDAYGVDYLLYKLFDKGSTSGYIGDSHTNDLKTVTISGIGYNKIKFKSNISTLGNDGSYQCIIKDNSNNDIMMNIITRVNITNLNHPYENDNKDYNNAQFGIQDIVVTRQIQFANEHIKLLDNVYKIYPNGFTGTWFNLFIAKNVNGVITMENVTSDTFKNNNAIGTDVTGMMYMYYIHNDTIKRIKYFYKNNDSDSTSDNNYISKYDYYTTSDIANINTSYSESQLGTYATKSYLNQYINNNNSNITDALTALNNILQSSSPMDIIIELIKAYNFYPLSVNETESDNVSYYNSIIGWSNTCGLAISNDCKRFFAASINNKNINNGSGFRLRDLIGSDYTIYQNHLAPHVSNTKKNGQTIYNIKTYNDYLKSTKVSDVFYTEEFPYLNGIGIRECYYKEKSLYEFYNYILTRNLAIPISDPKSLLYGNFNLINKVYFTRSEIEKVNDIKILNDTKKFVDKNSNPIEIKSNLSLHNNIDMNSIFGLNKSVLVDPSGNDMSTEYTSEDVILVNKEQAGNKIIYSLSISDGDPNIPVISSINGVMDNIEIDKLTWESLLISLHNNKSIDILSKSLIQIKTDLNDYIRLTGQNINDAVSIDNNITNIDANKHDTIYDENSNDSQETKNFKLNHYRDCNAEFDEKHNLYSFNYGYGFTNNERELNNRGVIVFISDGAKTLCQTNGYPNNPEQFDYDFTEGKIYPKRMYISKDGLICTKEYFDRENANSDDKITTIKSLQNSIELLKSEINSLKEQINSLNS